MFSGEFHYKVDAKGRMSVPADFRAAGDGKFYITYSPDRCLQVYDEQHYLQRKAELETLDEFNPTVRSIKRVFFSGMPLQECDSHGRVKLSAKMMEHAGINGDVVLNGMATYFEVWSAERWDAQRMADMENYFDNYRKMTAVKEHSEGA